MTDAVKRLRSAIDRREKILLYGDYDVDGTSAVVILKKAIELARGVADFHVPHRLRDGYGMKIEVIAAAADFYDHLRPAQQQQVREFMERGGRRWGRHG